MTFYFLVILITGWGRLDYYPRVGTSLGEHLWIQNFREGREKILLYFSKKSCHWTDNKVKLPFACRHDIKKTKREKVC